MNFVTTMKCRRKAKSDVNLDVLTLVGEGFQSKCFVGKRTSRLTSVTG